MDQENKIFDLGKSFIEIDQRGFLRIKFKPYAKIKEKDAKKFVSSIVKITKNKPIPFLMERISRFYQLRLITTVRKCQNQVLSLILKRKVLLSQLLTKIYL